MSSSSSDGDDQNSKYVLMSNDPNSKYVLMSDDPNCIEYLRSHNVRFIGKIGDPITRANIRPIVPVPRKILVAQHRIIRPPLLPNHLIYIQPPPKK